MLSLLLAGPWLVAQVNVTKTDTLIYDVNGNLLADPGDSLRYKTKVKNTSGMNVTGATFDVNASGNLGAPTTIRTTPLALNDVYAVTGNIGISVPAGSGLKVNDFDDNLALATIQVQVNQPTAMGGTVSVNADGSFTYTPAPGFTGADNFTYVLEDGNEVAGCPPINHAVVTLNVAAAAPAMIWFIDNSSVAATSDGRLNTPFKTIADFNASAGPQAGHIVFLENTGTNYTGPINLKNTQTLWGSGHTGGSNLADLITEALHSFTLPPINTTRPLINGGADGILLAMGNSIRGLNIGNCTDFGIDDNGGTVGALTISELNITNTSGGGFRASNGGTLAVTLGSLSSTGGPGGIHLGSCGGSFVGGTGTITSPNGIAVNIAGGTVGLTYSGNVTQANNFAMVSVSGGHNTGTVTFQTGTLNATNGTGLQFNNADSPTSYNFLGTTTLNGGSAAINIVNGSAGTFTFGASTSITNPADTAFNIVGGTAAVTYSGNITQANNFPMVSISAGHTTGTITFQTGTLNATNGSGLQFDNADSPTSYNFNGTTTLNGGDAGIDILNGSGGTFTFGTGVIITNPTGTAFNMIGSNAAGTYSGSITDNTGFAIDIDNHETTTFTFQSGSITSTATGLRVQNSNSGVINFNSPTKSLITTTNTAVDLTTNNGGGTMNFGNGGLAISTTTGIGFNATGGGTINVTGSGNTIIKSGNGNALLITSTNAGVSGINLDSIDVTGGTGTAVSISASTGVKSLGDVDVSRAGGGTGVFASNAGTLNTTGGTINSGNQIAIDIDNTLLGMTLRSISASGGPNGIDLNTTTGSFTVTGDGTNTSLGGNGSGGTLSSMSGADGLTTGNGIYLNNATNVSLQRMIINGTNQNFGVSASTVNGLSLLYVSVSGVNGNNSGFDEGSIFMRNATGTITITSCDVSGGLDDNLYCLYDNGTPETATYNVTGSSFRDLQTLVNNSMVRLTTTTAESSGSSITYNFTSSCIFENTANTLPPGGTENWADGILVTFEAPCPHTLNVRNSTFHHLFQGLDMASNFSADVNYIIKDNAITFTEGVGAIAWGTGSSTTSSAFITSVIQGNTIGTSGVPQSGNRLGEGIVMDFRGQEIAQVTVHNNTILRTELNGIRLIGQIGDGDVAVQVTNNTVDQIEDDAGMGAGVVYGIEITTNTGGSYDVCLHIQDNNSFNINAHDIRVRQATLNNTFALENFNGVGGNVAATVEAFLVAQNPLCTANVRTGGSVVNYTAGTCTTPPSL
jgi:hypothetical protein